MVTMDVLVVVDLKMMNVVVNRTAMAAVVLRKTTAVVVQLLKMELGFQMEEKYHPH